jgi:sigma-B regulation protein RsbU (phosphoserine phosphatase)
LLDHGAFQGWNAPNGAKRITYEASDASAYGAVRQDHIKAFQMEKHHNMFFTIWYGVYRKSTRALVYSGGGHPPPLMIPGSHGEIRELRGEGLPIGIIEDTDFPTLTTEIPPGYSLLLFSDGVTEVFSETGVMWGTEGLTAFAKSHSADDPTFLDQLHAQVASIARLEVLADDFSTVLARFD